jgi:dTDP-4-amino-4,6-dideoxygalactose transaminase
MKPIKFYKSDIGNREAWAVKNVIKSGWLTSGPAVKQLEAEWSRLSGYKHCISVNSATSGLFLAHIVANTARVYAPVYTFAATINVLELLDRDIEFLDCGKNSFNCAIPYDAGHDYNDCWMPVAISGCEWFKGADFKTNILDAAHCWPNISLTPSVEIAVWSLYVNKNIPCGDGGMIGTNNEAWAEKLRIMRNHGMSVDTVDRFNSKSLKVFYDVPMPGYKLNLTDLHAAIALEQLKKMDKNKARQKVLAERYNNDLPEEISRPFYAGQDGTEHLYMALCSDPFEREMLLQYLYRRGVSCSVHYKPIHRMSYYKNKYHLTDDMFPNASEYADREITLPLYPALRNSEQRYIIKCVKEFYV